MLENSEDMCDNAVTKDTANPEEYGCLRVRYAELEDLTTAVQLYMAALKEINLANIEPDLERCADEVLFSWSQAPCILIEKSGEIVGFAGLKTTMPAYSMQSIITEYMFYIRPADRSVKLAKILSDECKKVSDRFGLPLFFTHLLNGMTVDHKEKFLKRWGYNPTGVFCTYGVKNGQ